jgi:hypothetical protein
MSFSAVCYTTFMLKVKLVMLHPHDAFLVCSLTTTASAILDIGHRDCFVHAAGRLAGGGGRSYHLRTS